MLLNIGNNAKTIKSDAGGEYLTAILYLAPAKTSGYQACPSATTGCKASCLFTAGHGAFPKIQQARTNKTKLFFEQREMFRAKLYKEFVAFSKKCDSLGVKPAVRLNGTSDIYWPDKFPELFSDFPDFVHYAYTKEEKVMRKFMEGKCPPNYYVTFSRSEKNWEFCKEVLKSKFTVATVFDSVPKKYEGFKVFDADETDLRFLDPKGQIAGLKAKGKAKKDTTGFVVRGVINGQRSKKE